MSYRITLGKSAYDFKHIVWKKICYWFGEGQLIPIEGNTDVDLAELLDQNAGIDAWYIENKKGVRGLASRIQWEYKLLPEQKKRFPYNTFSIRYKKYNNIRTEYQKLVNAIKNNWIYPYWFVQAYLTKPTGRILSVAATKTVNIIKLLEKYPHRYNLINNHTDAWFKAVPWSHIKEKILVIDNTQNPDFFDTEEKQTLDTFLGGQ